MTVSRMIQMSIRQTLAAADKHKAKIPPAIRKELETSLALITAAETLDVTGQSLESAVFDSLAAGNDPMTDTNVHAAIVRNKIASLKSTDALTETARGRMYDTASRYVEEITGAFKAPFNKAGEQFADAHQILTAAGITDLDDPSILASSLQIAQANTRAREALDTIRAIDAAVLTLFGVLGISLSTPISRIVQNTETGETPAENLRVLGPGKKLHPWTALSNGYTISLATPKETRQREARAYAAQERQAAAGMDAEQQAYRKHHGSPVSLITGA